MSGMNLDDYLEKSGKSRDDLQKDWAPQASKRIVGSLIMTKLGEELEIEVKSEEIEEEMNKVLAKYKGMEDMFNDLLDPKKNKFQLKKVGDTLPSADREVWTDGKSVLINKEKIGLLMEEINKDNK